MNRVLAPLPLPGGRGGLTPKLPVGAWHGVKNWTRWDLFIEKMGKPKDLDITKIRAQKDFWNIQLLSKFFSSNIPKILYRILIQKQMFLL